MSVLRLLWLVCFCSVVALARPPIFDHYYRKLSQNQGHINNQEAKYREMDSAIKQLQYKYDFLLTVIRKLSQEQEVLNRELEEQRQSKRWVEATLANGKSYRFSLEKKTWQEAKESCEKNGMRLASPKTQREVTILHQKLKELEPESGFWLSASDVGLTNTDFQWLDGEKLPLDSSLWEKERLNAPLNYGKTAKSCVFIRKILDDKLYEEKCSDYTNFICE
ncbi:snaclec botrocetin subunit beta-like [Cloeon dipterum]|uniref:snaclec botrocetin subunit beta-like n=1 Tax=Cloeon dipterum TaxID=197152 RepID=UPI00321FFC12